MSLRELFTWLVDVPYLGLFMLWVAIGYMSMGIIGLLIGSYFSWKERRKYLNWRPRG